MVAQLNTSSLSGTVTDTTGASIPGAVVTVHSVATGLERSTKSGGKGEYSIYDLPVGAYTLTATAPSFGKYTTSFVASVGGFATVDVKLTVASQDVQVEVSADDAGATVNTTNAEVSQVITPLQVEQLPSVDRNPYAFVELTGNVSSDPNGSTSRGVGVSFSGGRAASTEILLDGVENTDLFSVGVGTNVPLDSVQEYRVISSGFDAQYGRASGGVVNVITKNGTNQFHGSLYYFSRLSDLAANTYFESAEDNSGSPIPHDHFTQNQFGYSVGGPMLGFNGKRLSLLKDKLFFFSNTEWNRVRSAGTQEFAVPTPAFLSTTAANTQAYFAQYGTIAPGVTVNANQPAGLAAGLEEVTVTAPIDAGAGNPVNAWFTSDRIDYNISDKTTTFYRYGAYHDVFAVGTNSLSPYNGFNSGSFDFDQTAVASVDHIFTPSLVSVTKFQFSRLNGGQPLGAAGVVPGLYLYSQTGASVDSVTGLPIALPGYLPTSPGNAIPFSGPQNAYQVQTDLNYQYKAHTLHVGGGYIQVRDNRTFGAYLNSTEFAGSTDGGEAGGLAALVAGQLYNYQVAINPGGKYPCIGGVQTAACTLTLPVGPPSFTHENTFNDGNWYVSDTWKVTPRLTATLGVRWEYYGVQHNTKPGLDTNFYPATGGSIYTNIENGVVEPAPSSPVGGLYQKRLKNYAPRIGLAYALTGDGKTSIRGGYGIAYERNFGNVGFNSLFNPPNYGVVDLTSGLNSPQIVISNNNYGPLAGAAGTTLPLPPVELRALDPHIPTAYAHNYNLTVEREVIPNTLAQISYTGTRGIHQYSIANENKLYSGAVYLGETNPDGSPSSNALNQQYSSINVREANGDSYYNGANIRVVGNNFSKYGLQFTFNYTFAHSLDDLSSTFSESFNNDNLGYTNPFVPRLDHGNSDFDVRHRIAIGAVYEARVPSFVHANSLTKSLLGGFEFSPLYTWNSGPEFTVYDCANALYSCDRILSAPGLVYKGNKPQAIGPDAYSYLTIPAAAINNYADPIVGVDDFPTFTANGGQYQTVGMDKDQFTGPHNWNLDMGVYKSFKILEKYDIQLRSEFYNLPNHHNYYASAALAQTYDNSTGFSVGALKGTQNGYSPSSSDERRFVQLAAKIVF